MSNLAFKLAFERVVGKGAVTRLVESFSEAPVLLLAGDQASGKSTTAKLLAEALGGTARQHGSARPRTRGGARHDVRRLQRAAAR